MSYYVHPLQNSRICSFCAKVNTGDTEHRYSD